MRRLAGILAIAAVAGAAIADILPGDITIIGFRSDNDDAISFVTWKAISAGTSVYFTDAGFFNDGTLRDSEDIMSWTAPVGGVTAGTVILISCPAAASSADVGTTTGNLPGLSTSGDQIFVGLTQFPDLTDTTKPGSSYSGTLIYGLDFNGTAGWDSDATGTSSSALPTALDGQYLNFGLATIDNGQYTGSRSAQTVDQFKALIHNSANWTVEDAGTTTLSSTDFAIIPEPGSAGLLTLAGLGFAFLRLRRRK